MKKIICGGILAVLLIASSASAGWFGPSTYEECVLENLKDVKTDIAARLVPSACRDKFPLKKVVLPSSAVDNITLSDAEVTGQNFKMTLHNNNYDWTVTNFQIMFFETGGEAGTVTPTSTAPPKGTVATGFEFEEVITSYGKSTIYLSLDPNKAYNWVLVGVEGYQ